jgi:EAL domain-containing protein (putative c-di-GMP-specific phosphodiesterase class I)
MDQYRLEISESHPRAPFGRRRVTPLACIVDRKRHIRKFFGEALEDLGFVTQDCAHIGELFTAVHTVLPDLVVLGLSGGGSAVVEQLQALAGQKFANKILLVGARNSPALGAVQELAEALGLAMLPALGTPYRHDDLLHRVGALLPREPPPCPPVDVAEALSAGWLELWYQAKIDARSLTLTGAEALIRVRHPSWGIVPPAYFIPDDGDPHFRALSEFVVTRAIADWTYFVTEHMAVKLAVNLPVALLEDPDAVERLRLQLPDHPAFDGLIVEINGTEISRDLDAAAAVARQLRFHNIGISIDDLGAEWSLLAGLDEFPFVELKVDRKFISGCAADRLKRAACRTILDLAGRFGVCTVAEGVETREDFRAVREMGFDQVQGFLFHKPMPAQKFARTMLSAGRCAHAVI